MSQSIKPVTIVPNLGLNITVALPATPMLTTKEARDFARITHSEDDTLLDAFVEAATMWVQKKLNRALINQTVIAEWDSVGTWVPLPYAAKVSATSITSIITIDDEGTTTTLVLNSDYHIRNNKIRVSTALGLRATYVAGYGTASSDVPSPIKVAIRRIVTGLYDRRDDESSGEDSQGIDKLGFNSLALLQPYINYAS